jgi:hypothetical protein
VFSNPVVNTLKSIPFVLRRSVATGLSTLVQRIVAYPQSVSAWADFFLFPRAVLTVMPSSKFKRLRRKDRQSAQVSFTRLCLEQWSSGGESKNSLIQMIIDTQPSPHPVVSEASKIKRCIRLCREDGQYGKAVQSLGSHGVAQPSRETTQILLNKHPTGPPLRPMDGASVTPLVADADEVMKVLLSFPKGSACGRSGLRFQHLLEMVGALPEFVHPLLNLVNLLLAGQAPACIAPFLASAPLVPLLKKDGGIRPIAVGEVMRRLVSKIAARRLLPKAAKLLNPLQLGVGTPNGTEGLIHGLNRILASASDPSLVILAVDFKNAFNEVSRQDMVDQVAKEFPEILQWVNLTYACEALLFSGSDIILSTSGVQQGDPLGPLLFPLVLQPFLQSLHDVQGVQVAAYLDDVTIVAPSPSKARASVDFLLHAGSSSGLHVALDKTTVWSPYGILPQDTFQDISIVTGKGVVILGSAISLDYTFIEATVQERVSKCIKDLDLLSRLGDPQLELLLLRSCLGMIKLNYCWRTSLPGAITKPMMHFQQAIIASLRRIVVGNGPHFGDFQLQLASLPLSLGGLGISLPSDIISFAYLASSLDSTPLQNRIFPPISSQSSSAISSLLDSFLALLPVENQESTRLEFSSPRLNHQKFLAKKYFNAKRLRLLSHPRLGSDNPFSKSNRFVLDSACQPLASQWLLALPNAGLSQVMTPLEFRAALSYRLLIPITSLSQCQALGCRGRLDPFGYHVTACGGNDNKRKLRHDIVVHGIFDLARLGGFHPIKDGKVQCLGFSSSRVSHLRPADLLISGDDFHLTCVDVTVVSPLPKSLPATLVIGKAASDAELGKDNKYLVECERAGYGFQPFAVDVFGSIGPSSLKFLCRLASAFSRFTNKPYSYALSLCYRRISFSIHLGVARQLTPFLLPSLDFQVCSHLDFT